ncbi:sugar isomerase [Elstera litoralis]|uniref:Sugar isomerase n=1 Tax=Elstera litoralis TaxID=552518 RepID=A0A0F3IQY5_9PROT|nr:L-rhamnose catabolism isomerase [Elstera litoralis]KJV09145.1 sugar isomerase [Elstera litoralis]
MSFRISADAIGTDNARRLAFLEDDYAALKRQMARRGIDLDAIADQVAAFGVALPSWGVGTGGTRFARFAGSGEPRGLDDKLEDCATIHQLTRATPTVSLHFPWDKPSDATALKAQAASLGLGFDAVNSNTFQDQPGQPVSYKFGSLSHPDKAVRDLAVAHNIDCIRLGETLGAPALTVWVGDGANFPGQQNFTAAFDRYLDSMAQIYAALPQDWSVFIEHKLFEPAFYATVIADWGSSYLAATELGPKAKCLVDLGHHAPNTNIEMIVARLVRFGKLAGFHFNDSKYGDDDLDSGSINPFQLFLIFNELVDAAQRGTPGFAPAYMLDQSHNVTDPIESLMNSAMEVQRRYAQALLIDRAALTEAQTACDALGAHNILKQAFNTDVSPLLAEVRHRAGGAIDPLALYRASGYRAAKAQERPPRGGSSAGIV